MKENNIVALVAFKKFLVDLDQVKNEDEMFKIIGNFSCTYQPINAKELTFAFPIRKAQKGFLREIENLITKGMYHDLSWHKQELRYQAEEMVELLREN